MVHSCRHSQNPRASMSRRASSVGDCGRSIEYFPSERLQLWFNANVSAHFLHQRRQQIPHLIVSDARVASNLTVKGVVCWERFPTNTLGRQIVEGPTISTQFSTRSFRNPNRIFGLLNLPNVKETIPWHMWWYCLLEDWIKKMTVRQKSLSVRRLHILFFKVARHSFGSNKVCQFVENIF